jgi:hypothetical protein
LKNNIDENKEGLRIVDGVLIIPEGTEDMTGFGDAWTYMKAHGGFTRIQFPMYFTHVWTGEFEGCASLKELTFPEGFLYIYPEAFSNCPELVSVTFPDSLQLIGHRAFADCDKLEKVHMSQALYQGFMSDWEEDVRCAQPDLGGLEWILYEKYQKRGDVEVVACDARFLEMRVPSNERKVKVTQFLVTVENRADYHVTVDCVEFCLVDIDNYREPVDVYFGEYVNIFAEKKSQICFREEEEKGWTAVQLAPQGVKARKRSILDAITATAENLCGGELGSTCRIRLRVCYTDHAGQRGKSAWSDEYSIEVESKLYVTGIEAF